MDVQNHKALQSNSLDSSKNIHLLPESHGRVISLHGGPGSRKELGQGRGGGPCPREVLHQQGLNLNFTIPSGILVLCFARFSQAGRQAWATRWSLRRLRPTTRVSRWVKTNQTLHWASAWACGTRWSLQSRLWSIANTSPYYWPTLVSCAGDNLPWYGLWAQEWTLTDVDKSRSGDANSCLCIVFMLTLGSLTNHLGFMLGVGVSHIDCTAPTVVRCNWLQFMESIGSAKFKIFARGPSLDSWLTKYIQLSIWMQPDMITSWPRFGWTAFLTWPVGPSVSFTLFLAIQTSDLLEWRTHLSGIGQSLSFTSSFLLRCKEGIQSFRIGSGPYKSRAPSTGLWIGIMKPPRPQGIGW